MRAVFVASGGWIDVVVTIDPCLMTFKWIEPSSMPFCGSSSSAHRPAWQRLRQCRSYARTDSSSGRRPLELCEFLVGHGLILSQIAEQDVEQHRLDAAPVVAPAELSQIAVQVLGPQAVITSGHPTLEEREGSFDGLIGHLAAAAGLFLMFPAVCFSIGIRKLKL
jgi:hypothetical protein